MPRTGIGRLLKQLQVEDWLGRRVDEFYSSRSPERWVKPDLTIHPSAAGHECPRAIELQLLGHRGAVKERNRRRMDNGSDAHRRWQRDFREMGLLVAHEHPVSHDDPVISGSMDLVLRNPLTGSVAFGEIKTTNTRKFGQLPQASQDRAANARGMRSWHRDWFVQFTLYCEYGRYNGAGPDERFFLIENTDNQDYRIIWVEPTPDQVEEAKRAPAEAQVAARSGKVIVRPFEKGSKACQWCDHAQVCDLLSEGEVETWAMVRDQFRRLGIPLRLTPEGSPPPSGPGATP